MLNIDTTLYSIQGQSPQPATTTSVAPTTTPATPQEQTGEPNWWDRASANFRDAWRTGTLAGAATTAAQTEVGADTADVEAERRRRREFESMRSWTEAPDAATKLKEFSAMVAGQVAGSLASPETLLGPATLAPKAINWAARGATALSRLGRRAAVGAGTQAGINVATDPAIQGANIASGVQDEYNVTQTALAPVLGAAVGGVTGAARMGMETPTVRNAEEAVQLRELVTGRRLEGWEREAFMEAAEIIRQSRKPADLAKYAGNLNLERIRAGEDVMQLIQETAEANKPMLDAIRRGTISNEQLQDMADELQLTPQKLIEMSKPGAAVSPEVATAARRVELDLFTEYQGIVSAAAKNPTPENLARQEASAELTRQVFAAVSGFRAEAGRTMQSFNIVLPGEDRVNALKLMFERYPELAKDTQAQTAMMKALSSPAGVRDMLAKIAPPGPRRTIAQIAEAWKAGLLTGIRTTTTNILSNSAVTVLDPISQMGASLIGKVRPVATGGDEGRSMAGAMSRLYAMFGSANDELGSWANFREAWRTSETPKIFGTRTEGEEVAAIPGKLGEVIRTPFRFLVAQDAFFKAAAARQELTASAWDAVMKLPEYQSMNLRDRLSWVNDFVANPPKEALHRAQLHANYQTFNKELGKLGNSIVKIVNDHPEAQFIVPFVKTPINLAKYGFEYTPLVAINPSYRTLRGQEADIAMAKAVLGSSLMFGFYSMALEGRITGAGPIDPAARQSLMATGWKPYSIRIGDKFYPYEKWQPISFLLGVAADTQYLINQVPAEAATRGLIDKDGEITQADLMVAYGVHIFMENVVNNSFTSQLNNLFKALNDPSQSKVDALLNTFAGSLVPTIVGDVARAMDPTVRQVSGPLEAIQSRIPGASQSLLPKRDWTGEPVTREYSPIEQMISPSLPSTIKDDKTRREVARVDFRIPIVPKTFNGVKLTPEQQNFYAEVVGKDREFRLRQFVNSPGYDRMANRPGGDELVRQQMSKITAGVSKAAEARLMQRYPELRTSKPDQTIRAFELEPRREQPSLTRQ